MKKTVLKKALLILGFSFSHSLAFPQIGLSPLAENQRYSFITVTPSTKGSPETEKLKKIIEAQVQSIAEEAIKTTVLALGNKKNMTQIFVQLGEEMNKKLSPFIQKININLPNEEPLVFSTYITPYTKIEKTTPLYLPVINEAQVYAFDHDQHTAQQGYQFYTNLKTNILNLPVNTAEQFQFVTLASHIRLVKNYVHVKVQLMGQLKSHKMDFLKSNDEVNISHLSIESTKNEKPLVIVDITQQISTSPKDKVKLPEVNLDFGQFGGFSGGYAGRMKGELQIYKDLTTNDGCSRKIGFTPRLIGKLGAAPAGRSFFKYPVNKFLKDRPVNFHIFSLKFNPETFKVSDMQVVTSLNNYSFLSCVKTDDVNKKFMDEANSAIDDVFKSIYKQDAVSEEMVQALFE